MVALIAALVALLVSVAAEWLHWQRIRRLGALVFGPARRTGLLAAIAPALRVAAITALAWGLPVLFMEKPRNAGEELNPAGQTRHVVLLMDVSPSMRLVDAGPDGKQSRAERARDLLLSFFDRVPIRQYRVSLVAFYDQAIPVVVDTNDMEVIINALSGLPMHFAFKGPRTNLFAGLEAAARLCRPWNPDSTTLIVVSDGDTVPATGMPRMPDSVSGVLVVGVGDQSAGKFIDGRHSRQDVPTLRQIAARSAGEFHNGNEKQISTELIRQLSADQGKGRWQPLTRREYALLAILGGAAILGLLPVALHYFGSTWQPGVRQKNAGS